MDTETLPARDQVPGALPTSSKVPAEQQVHHIRETRYLVVDQSANRHHSSKVSKIWQDGMELWALDTDHDLRWQYQYYYIDSTSEERAQG